MLQTALQHQQVCVARLQYLRFMSLLCCLLLPSVEAMEQCFNGEAARGQSQS